MSEIDWTPLKKGGANFQTHKLVRLGPETVVFKPTKGALAFYYLFLLFGVVPSGLAFWELIDRGFGWRPELLIPFGFGAVFGTIGFIMFAFGTRPIVFDKSRDYYWKGRKDPDAVWSHEELKHFADLGDIHGLQIVTESVSGGKSPYNSYELNLVLRDRSRLNVVDHGKKENLESDASALAEFLDVPLLTR